MARSRNIKPSLFKNEILGEADPIYTLLFAGLWTLADREGRLEYRPKKIKAELFPYRFDLDPCLGLAWLMHESFITVYESKGKKYIQINNWKKHQNPHHKEVDSEIPPIEKGEVLNKLDENQIVTHACAMHESSTNQAQSKENASCPTDSLNLIPDSLNPDSLNSDSGYLIPSKTLVELKPDDALEVFKFWQSTMNHPRAAFDDKRKALIRKWLKNYSVDDLKKAILGCSVTPHNMGDNDQGAVYDSIELIFRSAGQVDRFMKNADNPPSGNIKTIEQTRSNANAQADRIAAHLGAK